MKTLTTPIGLATALTMSVVLTASITASGCATDANLESPEKFSIAEPPLAAKVIPKPAILNAAACAPLRADYPEDSWRAGESGTVVIEFAIKSDGSLIAATVIRSSGFPKLDSVALTKLSTCKFAPARTAAGKPIDAKLSVEYVWKRA